MRDVYTALRQSMDRHELNYRLDVDRQAVIASFNGDHGTYTLIGLVDPHLDLVQFMAVIPVPIPEEERDRVSEVITRANWGLKVGKFEMDYTDGEVRFQASTFFDETIGEKTFCQMMAATLGTVDRYFPAILRVLYNEEMSAEDAVAEIEG